jgi:hypothetical protein
MPSRAATAFTVLVLAAAFMSGCSVVVDGVRGSGDVVSEERSLDTFTSVVASGSGEVRISQGDVQSVTVQAEDNLVPLLVTEVRGGVLTLRVEEGSTIRPTEPIVFDITVAGLQRVESRGSGDVVVDRWEATDADIASSGSGDVAVDDLLVESLTVSTTGSGDVVVSGESDVQRVATSGSGDYRACGLGTAAADVETSGSGDAVVTVTERLVAESSGSGSILYSGDPDDVSEDSSGSGDVEPIGTCP